MFQRRGIAIGLIAAAGLVLVACSSGAPPSDDGSGYQIAGTIPLAGNTFWVSFECGGTAAAEEAGSTVQWFESTSAADNALIRQSVQAAVVSNPNGLVLSPAGSVDNSATLESLAKSNIPVIETNSIQGEPYYQAVLSPEEDPNVVALAQMIVEESGGKGTVSILAGEASVPAITYRWKPLVEELERTAPDLNVLDTQFTGFDASKTASIVKAQIVANPDLVAIFSTSGPESTGVISGVTAAGKAGQIATYSFDANPDQVEALKEGTVTALLAQSPYDMGKTAVENLIALLDERGDSTDEIGQSDQPKVEIPTLILTKHNIDDPGSAEYLYKASCD